MSYVKIPRGWEIAESLVTDESRYLRRREFMRLGAGAAAAGLLAATGCRSAPRKRSELEASASENVPSPEGQNPIEFGTAPGPSAFEKVPNNPEFAIPDGRVLAEHETAASFNNFYEFTTRKSDVWKKVGLFETRPWTVEVGGLVHNPKTFDVDDLIRKMPAEERIYRMRCVEAWSMVLPWTGFPMRALLDAVQPLGSAKFVRFWTAELPKQMPGQRNTPWYPWPYHEALSIEEASNDLTLLVTGMYGKRLPRQNGAPIRLVVPWKYGYKSIKSVVKIELVAERPTTFWNSLEPEEYGFWSNVDPTTPHPRWSQAMERDIQTNEKIETLPFNGYGDFVADLYRDIDTG